MIGLEATPLERTIADTIAWLVASGRVPPRYLG